MQCCFPVRFENRVKNVSPNVNIFQYCAYCVYFISDMLDASGFSEKFQLMFSNELRYTEIYTERNTKKKCAR